MIRFLFTALAVMALSVTLLAQPNCEVYRADEDCYDACQLTLMAIRFPQGSAQSQSLFDQSIDRCNTVAYAHMEKAVPFLKRGLFGQWKQQIDRAVALDPVGYLGYRGWCRLQFLKDYRGCIDDLDRLDDLTENNIGYSQNGDYHLEIVRALCYKQLGQLDTARALLFRRLNADNYVRDLYDYYHLGVLEYEAGNYPEAIEHLSQQLTINDYMAGTYYYLALAHRALGNKAEYQDNLNRAEAHYRAGKVRTDAYADPIDKVYLVDILAAKER